MDLTTEPTYDHPRDHTAVPTEVPTGALTVAEAAEALGITTEAARMRVKRGTLPSTRIGGTVYVLVDRPNPEPHGSNAGPNHGPKPRPNGRTDGGTGALLAAKDETIEELRDRVGQLTSILEARDEEIRRRDTIIMQMARRVPELEVSKKALENECFASEGAAARVEDRKKPEKRSWWRTIFGG